MSSEQRTSFKELFYGLRNSILILHQRARIFCLVISIFSKAKTCTMGKGAGGTVLPLKLLKAQNSGNVRSPRKLPFSGQKASNVLAKPLDFGQEMNKIFGQEMNKIFGQETLAPPPPSDRNWSRTPMPPPQINTSVESQNGVIAIQRCSVKNQKGAIAVQSLWR